MWGSNPGIQPGGQTFNMKQALSFRQAAKLDDLDEKKAKTMSVPIKMPGMGKMNSQQFLDPIETQMKKIEESAQKQLNHIAKQETALDIFQKTLIQMKSRNEKLMGVTAFDSKSIFAKRIADIHAKDGKDQTYLSCQVSERAEQRDFTVSIVRLAQKDKLEPVDPNVYIEVPGTSQAVGVEGTITLQGQQVVLTTNMSLNDIHYALECAGNSGNFSVYLNTVTQPGPGTNGKYRLQIMHKDLATPLTATDDPATAPLNALNLKASGKTSAKLSSVCFIDEMEVQRPNNEIKDFLKGVTLTLKRPTPDPILDKTFLDVSIALHTDAIQQGIRDFLESVGTFAEAYNLYCGRDNEGNPLSEDAVLAKTGFVFLTKVRDFLIGPRGFFPAPGKSNLDADISGKMLEEENGTFLGLNLFGMNLERNDVDSTLQLQFEEEHLKSIVEKHATATQRFFDFSFQSSNPRFNMLDFPDHISVKLYKQSILVKAWKDQGTGDPCVAFALNVEHPDFVRGEFKRSGEIKGLSGTLYEGISLYTVDFFPTLGDDPTTAVAHTISFSKGKAREYTQAIENLETHTLKPEIEKLAKQKIELIKKNKQQLTKLQKELEKTQQGISKMVNASQKWTQIEQHLKQINGSKKDE